jgi:hypothetical protein
MFAQVHVSNDLEELKGDNGQELLRALKYSMKIGSSDKMIIPKITALKLSLMN